MASTSKLYRLISRLSSPARIVTISIPGRHVATFSGGMLWEDSSSVSSAMPFQKEGPSLPRLPSGSSPIYKTNLASSVLLPSHAERGGASGSKPPYTTSTEGAAFFSPPSQSEECGEEARRFLNGLVR